MSFEWKDYADRGRRQIMTLDAVEFIRRFLLHVLPSGLVRIRQFGFLANRVRTEKLELSRVPLGTGSPPKSAGSHQPDKPRCCLSCKHGHLLLIEIIPREPSIADTS